MTAYHVLFLCTGNSARSIMAEAILNQTGGGRFRAFSAGSKPTGQVSAQAIDLLQRNHYPIAGLRSKDWREFGQPEAPHMHFVLTVCDQAAGEVCPIWPGQPISAHWGVPDPALAVGNDDQIKRAYTDAFVMLSRRIALLVNLPIEALDRLALQTQIEAIGQPPASP
jgi:arsenate reductase